MYKKFERFVEDCTGVSPVVGVILMVAVTVILSAVIGAFVFDLGSNTQQNPSAGVTFDEADGEVTVTAISMDNADKLRIESSDETEEIDSVGGSASVPAGDVSVVGILDGNEAVIQTYEVESVSDGDSVPDVVVAADGSSEFETIQAGVDAAESGDSVLVKPGTYGNVGHTVSGEWSDTDYVAKVDKSISLVAENGARIENESIYDGLYITADDVSVENFESTLSTTVEGNDTSFVSNSFTANLGVDGVASGASVINNTFDGAQLNVYGDSLRAEGNTFTDIGYSDVYAAGEGAVLRHNEFDTEVSADGDIVVDARENYWGTNEPERKISEGSDSTVEYIEWCADASCSTLLSEKPEDGIDHYVVAQDGSGDYESIYEAVKASDDGETIEVKSGTYTEEVVVYKNLDIYTNEGATVDGAGNNAFTIDSGASPTIDGFTITNASSAINDNSGGGDWTLTNAEITEVDRAARAGDGDWTMEDTTIQNTEWAGISAYGSSGDWSVNNVEIHDSGGEGIEMRRAEGDWSIDSVTVTNADGVGINVNEASASGAIRDTSVTGSSSEGILANDIGGGLTVENVAANNNGGIGLSATNASSLTVADSEMSGNAKSGLDASESETFTVNNAEFTDNVKSGILATGATGSFTIKNAYFNNNSANEGTFSDHGAISVAEASGEFTIDAVTIEDTGSSGIVTKHSSSGFTIEDTEVLGTNENYGIDASQSNGDWEIQNVTVTDAADRGIRAGGDGSWWINDTTVEHGGSYGMSVYGSGGWLVSNTTAHNNDWHGGSVTIDGGEVGVIRDSEFTDNGGGDHLGAPFPGYGLHGGNSDPWIDASENNTISGNYEGGCNGNVTC